MRAVRTDRDGDPLLGHIVYFFEAKCWASPLKELGALYCRLSARQEMKPITNLLFGSASA